MKLLAHDQVRNDNGKSAWRLESHDRDQGRFALAVSGDDNRVHESRI